MKIPFLIAISEKNKDGEGKERGERRENGKGVPATEVR